MKIIHNKYYNLYRVSNLNSVVAFLCRFFDRELGPRSTCIHNSAFVLSSVISVFPVIFKLWRKMEKKSIFGKSIGIESLSKSTF